jgi:hypothetical protein
MGSRTRTFQRFSAVAAFLALLAFAGCSQSTTPAVDASTATAPAAAPQPVTAKVAFGLMYKSALAWSSDVQLLTLKPMEVPGFKNDAGKAAMWEAQFASPSKVQYRAYTYSIATVSPVVHKGVGTRLAMRWAGVTRDVMAIDLSAFTIDSDAAYQAAATDAGAWLKKNPDKQLTTIEAGSTYKFTSPVWLVQWGDKKAGYVALIDAATGKVYKSK